jgi:hypothetical protein
MVAKESRRGFNRLTMSFHGRSALKTNRFAQDAGDNCLVSLRYWIKDERAEEVAKEVKYPLLRLNKQPSKFRRSV